VLSLVRTLLRAGVMQDGSLRRGVAGTPQGGVVSPLLANVYLHRLDRAWQAREHGVLVRYADDVLVLCTTREQAEAALARLAALLAELGLEPKAAKTRIVHLVEGGEGFDFLVATRGRMVRDRTLTVQGWWTGRPAYAYPTPIGPAHGDAQRHRNRHLRAARAPPGHPRARDRGPGRRAAHHAAALSRAGPPAGDPPGLPRRLRPLLDRLLFAGHWPTWPPPVQALVRQPAHPLPSPRWRPAAALLLPPLGAAGTELLPQLRTADPAVLATAATLASINAAAEELLWHGLFVATFPDDPVRGWLWPAVGFTAWHLAPLSVRPYRHGTLAFLVPAGLIGAGYGWVVWRTGSLRLTLPAHIATDASGLRAAHFWLGR
jgi:Reverse transcriptase (RNA-dependent DNA polymerase)/Type II CAAX prenyl endopeptidase Rce1-like